MCILIKKATRPIGLSEPTVKCFMWGLKQAQNWEGQPTPNKQNPKYTTKHTHITKTTATDSFCCVLCKGKFYSANIACEGRILVIHLAFPMAREFSHPSLYLLQ